MTTMSGGARGGSEPAVEDVSGMDIGEDVWNDANDGGDDGDPEPAPARQPSTRNTPAARQAQPEPEESEDDPEADPDADPEADPDAVPEGEEPTDEEIEAQAEAELEALQAPQNWPAEEKKFFGALPPVLQHAYMNRARSLMADYTKKTQEVARVRQNYAELDRVITPRIQSWAVGGMSPAMAVTQLLALSDFASAKPMEFIQYFAQERGIDLTKLPGAAQQGEQGYVDPQIRQLRDQIEALKRQNEQATTEQKTRMEAARREQYQNAVNQMAAQIEQFATLTDNKGRLVNPYFNEVEDEVTKLLSAGAAATLPDAYKMAIWANPSTRAKMLARTRSIENVKARARAEAAKRAASSVTSVNGSGGRGTAKAPGEMSVGELLRAAARGDIS